MATTTKTFYKIGDLSNGDLDTFETQEEALEALREAISEGTLSNMECIGEEGCPWKTEEDAREAAEEFFYLRKITVEIDEDGNVLDGYYEVIE